MFLSHYKYNYGDYVYTLWFNLLPLNSNKHYDVPESYISEH